MRSTSHDYGIRLFVKLKIILILSVFANAQAQEPLPPPKIIAAPDQQQDQQPEQPEQQALPDPKPLEQPGAPQKGQMFAIVKVKEDFYVMVDPNLGRHPCYRDDNKNIFCRW